MQAQATQDAADAASMLVIENEARQRELLAQRQHAAESATIEAQAGAGAQRITEASEDELANMLDASYSTPMPGLSNDSER
jgi:hypothetical protein